MPKDDWLHVRIDTELKEKLTAYAKENNYEDVATFVREALLEKIDPTRGKNEIKEKIKLALQEDPSLLDDSLRRIGIRFYARKSDDQ